jgi:hypothetical protein
MRIKQKFITLRSSAAKINKKYSALQEINFIERRVSYEVSALYRVLCTVMEDN